MSDRPTPQKLPQKPVRKTRKIALTVMGVAAAGVIGLALFGGDDTDGDELRRNSYASREDCVADYSAEQCEPQPLAGSSATTTTSGSSGMAWIGPAYLAGRMMGGGYGGQSGFMSGGQPGAMAPLPGQRQEEQQAGSSSGGRIAAGSGGYARPAGDPGPGRTQGTAAAVPRMSVANVSRGGFGSTSRSFSSSSSS